MELNYVSVDEIINEAEHIVSSYTQAGLVSTDFLYPYLQRCLANLGATILPTKETILNVENFGVRLPDDYHSLILLMGSSSKATLNIPPQAQVTYETPAYIGSPISAFVTNPTNIEIDIPIAFNNPIGLQNPTFAFDEKGAFSITQRINSQIYYHNEVSLLTLGTNMNNCFNPFNKHRYDVEIKNKHIYTNFEKGVVFMEYRAMSQDDIMVPDIPLIKEWLINESIVKILSYLYLNTTNDIIQKLQYAKAELHVAKQNASNVWRSINLEQFKDLKRYLQNNFIKTSRIAGHDAHKRYENIVDIHNHNRFNK